MLLKDKRVDKTLLNKGVVDAEVYYSPISSFVFLDSLRFIWRWHLGTVYFPALLFLHWTCGVWQHFIHNQRAA